MRPCNPSGFPPVAAIAAEAGSQSLPRHSLSRIPEHLDLDNPAMRDAGESGFNKPQAIATPTFFPPDLAHPPFGL